MNTNRSLYTLIFVALLISPALAFAQIGTSAQDAISTQLGRLMELQSGSIAKGELRQTTLMDAYIAARQSQASYQDYSAALALIGVGDPAAPERQIMEEAQAWYAELGEMLAASPPIPGTGQYRIVERRLAELARGRGVDIDLARQFTEDLKIFVTGAANENAVRLFIADLHIETDFIPASVPPNDAAPQVLDVWWLLFLAQPTDIQARSSLARVVDATSRVGPALAATGATILESMVVAERRREQLWVTPGVLAGISAAAFSDPESIPPPAARALGRLIRILATDDLPALLDQVRIDVDLRFAADMLRHLLAAGSDLQRFTFARHLAIQLDDIRRLAPRLAYISAEIQPDYELATPPAASVLFLDFLAEGETYVESARRWAATDEARTGDAYRWTMLPILSQPYAQYLLSTDPEMLAARSLALKFVVDLYQDALSRVERRGVIPFELHSDTDSPLLFDRVYTEVAGADRNALFNAFTAAGQGVSELPAGMTGRHVGRITLAGYWSHSYGLHVVAASPTSLEEEFQNATNDWFVLAGVAETDAGDIGYQYRALMSLRVLVSEQLAPVMNSGAVVGLGTVAPRLEALWRLLDEVAVFRAEPSWALSEISNLYVGTRRVPTSVRRGDNVYAGLISAIVVDVETLVRRVQDIELADTAVLLRTRGGTE